MKKRVLIRLENVILNMSFFNINEQDKIFLEWSYNYTKQGGSITKTSAYDMFCEHTEDWIKDYICKYYANINERKAYHIWNPLLRYIESERLGIRMLRYYVPQKSLDILSRQELFNLWNQIINYEHHMSSVDEEMRLSTAAHGSWWTALEMAILIKYLKTETVHLLPKLLPGRTKAAIASKAIDYGLGKRVPTSWRIW